MASSATKKRRSIEIKEVEQKNRRYVTFSKRKLGLFNKLTELSLLCQVQTALIITSQNGKLYSCGYPDAHAVLRRYLTGGPPLRPNSTKQQDLVEKLRLEYEALQNQLKEEQKLLQEIKETQNNSFCFPPWWNLPIEDMDLDNLEQFKTSLEALKVNLVGVLQEKQMNTVPPMPSTMVPPMSSTIVSPMPSAIVSPMPCAIVSPMPYAMVSPMPSTMVPPIPHSMLPPTPHAIVPPMSSTMFPPMPHAIVPPPQFPNTPLLGTQSFSGNKVQDYRRSGADTSLMFPSSGFGHF